MAIRYHPVPHDVSGYFDFSLDMASSVREDIALALQSMGMEVEMSHHEVAPGQHEIDIRYGDALSTADNAVTLRYTVKTIARRTTCTPPSCQSRSSAQRLGHARAPELLRPEATTPSTTATAATSSREWPTSSSPGSSPTPRSGGPPVADRELVQAPGSRL